MSLIEQTHGLIRIGCDSEFERVTTLTTQFAVRSGSKIIVQMYHNPEVPPPPQGFSLRQLAKRLGLKRQDLLLRPVKILDADLSPVRVLRDLFNLQGVKAISRVKGDELPEDPVDTKLTVCFIAHYLPADFLRMQGRKHLTRLIRACTEGGANLFVQANKLLSFREKGKHRYEDPVLEYARESDNLVPVRVQTFDTSLPFGKGSLDDHAQTFLHMQKLETITKADKAQMLATFQTRTADAYLYAALDAILTLLVQERMGEEDHKMYLGLDFTEEEVPKLRPTQGSRVAEMIMKSIARTTATCSFRLSQKGKPKKDGTVGKVSLSKVRTLLSKGAAESLAPSYVSRFGRQTGEVHGGLLFSRSPDRFFHEAPGHFADVDLSGCYATIISALNLYLGQPVVFEPGTTKMKLKDAVRFLEKNAAGRDAWIIKASGKIVQYPNVLIPSTKDALTNTNFKSRKAKKQSHHRRYGFVFDWVVPVRKDMGNTTIYTDVIEAGIVAWPTWLLIQALPPVWRKEYENLEVDTLIFYPNCTFRELPTAATACRHAGLTDGGA
jgi:hypothetical protein